MPTLNHTPINYNSWNFLGIGNNIFGYLNSIEEKIWDSALSYQDKRNDTGHAENVTYFALKLLNYIPEDRKLVREIVVPSAILHDIGWSQLTETERKLFYECSNDGKWKQVWERYEPILRLRHQEQGVCLSGRLLNELNYPLELTSQILEIISQHDTRKDFLNENDGIMRDADKLWRYTLPHLKLGLRERNLNPDEFAQFLVSNINKEGFFYSPISREIAEIELNNALAYWKQKQIK